MFAVSRFEVRVATAAAVLVIGLTGCSSSSTEAKQNSNASASTPSPTEAVLTQYARSAGPVESGGGYPPKDLCSNKPGVQAKAPVGLRVVIVSAREIDPTLPPELTTECVTPSVVKQRVALRGTYEREARQEYMTQASVREAQGAARLDRIMDYFCGSKSGKEAYYRMIPTEEAYNSYRATHRIGLESGQDGEFIWQAVRKCMSQIDAWRAYMHSPAGAELHTAAP